jgi:hypothetical protein
MMIKLTDDWTGRVGGWCVMVRWWWLCVVVRRSLSKAADVTHQWESLAVDLTRSPVTVKSSESSQQEHPTWRRDVNHGCQHTRR